MFTEMFATDPLKVRYFLFSFVFVFVFDIGRRDQYLSLLMVKQLQCQALLSMEVLFLNDLI